jgi:hypothetical protein
MTIEKKDLERGTLNVKGRTRYLYKSFSVGGEPNPAYEAEFDRVFGDRPSPFCKCGRRIAWCECPEEQP